MRSRSLSAAAALSLAIVLASSFAQAASASVFVGGTGDWTLVGDPTVQTLGASQAAELTYENHLATPVLGVVIMVLHNNIGQTVYYTTATINLNSSSYGTVFLVEYGVNPGVYNATFFAFSVAGIAISNCAETSFPAR